MTNSSNRRLTMRADILREWIDDLRSGQHEQGKGALCQGGAWCCLGRLTDICARHGYGAMAEGPNGMRYQLPNQVGLGDNEDGNRVSLANVEDGDWCSPFGVEDIPPSELLDWLSTPNEPDSTFLRVEHEGRRVELYALNDGLDWLPALTFPQIADLIEAQIEPVEPVDQPAAA